MGSRRAVLLLVPALAAVALSACLSACSVSEEPRTGPAPAAAARDNTPVEPTWTLDEEVLGQPVVTGRTAVVLVRARTDEVDVVAVDADSGQERWRAPYQPVINSFHAAESFVTDGDGERPAVVFPAPEPSDDEFLRRVRSVAPLTGRDLFDPPVVAIVGPVGECPDGEDACATGTDDDGYGGGPQRILRVGPSSSSVGRDYSGAPDAAYTAGPDGVFLLPGGPGNGRIGRAQDGRVLFTRTVTDLLGPGFDANKGADFDRDPRARVLVGSVAPAQSERAVRRYEGRGLTLDLDRWNHLVGLDQASGRLLWRAPGADRCAGSEDPGAVRARCVSTGTVTFRERRQGGEYSLEDSRVEGYSPRSGATTWSVELSAPDQERWADQGREIAAGDSGPVVLPLPEGPAYVDLTDGDVSPVDPADRFACLGREVLFGYGDDEADDARRGGRLVSPCDAEGRPAGDVLVADAVREAGEAVGDERRDTWVLSTEDGLAGYALGAD